MTEGIKTIIYPVTDLARARTLTRRRAVNDGSTEDARMPGRL
jgi:hypothetical protein